jgi:hypothetical protein
MEAKIILVQEEEFDPFSNSLNPREGMWGHMPVRCFCFGVVYSYIIIFILEEQRQLELMP